MPDLFPEAFSEMRRKGLGRLAPVEISGKVGTDGPAAIIAGGRPGGIDVLQQVWHFIREAQGQSGILVVLLVSMICQENCFMVYSLRMAILYPS